ncbi:MAG: DUF86 domain-containing protein [Dictyoglomaceae bacterium]|nr:DUF86 domain-containing protein [Dictyoglomaceae bacterium]
MMILRGYADFKYDYDKFIEELYDLSQISDKKLTAACESLLRRTLEAIFDIGRHILAKSGYVDMGIVDSEIGNKLKEMAGYRKRCGSSLYLNFCQFKA